MNELLTVEPELCLVFLVTINTLQKYGKRIEQANGAEGLNPYPHLNLPRSEHLTSFHELLTMESKS